LSVYTSLYYKTIKAQAQANARNYSFDISPSTNLLLPYRTFLSHTSFSSPSLYKSLTAIVSFCSSLYSSCLAKTSTYHVSTAVVVILVATKTYGPKWADQVWLSPRVFFNQSCWFSHRGWPWTLWPWIDFPCGQSTILLWWLALGNLRVNLQSQPFQLRSKSTQKWWQ
jgi:hypothetical protein